MRDRTDLHKKKMTWVLSYYGYEKKREPPRDRSLSRHRRRSDGSAGGYGRRGRLNRVGGQHGRYRGHGGQQQDIRGGRTSMTR